MTVGRMGVEGTLTESKRRGLPAERLASMVFAKDGPLTQELVQSPAKFGLGSLPLSQQPDATIASTCGFCSTGCSLEIHLRDGVAIGLTPRTEYPVNRGLACPKGWEALRVLQSPDRGTIPLIRRQDGSQADVDWLTAAKTFAESFQAIQRVHGPESVAFLSTGQIVNEEMAFLGCLAKFGMGMLHGDGNTRQCMATAATAYKQSFGFDAPPYTYDDFEQSDVLIFIGANPCIAHPIMWQRVLRNRHSPKIIVVDPRRTETAMMATEHAAIRPKSDLRLLYTLANLLVERDAIDWNFIERSTTDFDNFRDFVSQFDVGSAADACGVPAEQIRRIADYIAGGRAVSFWWTMGVNQSYEGTRTAQSIINLALMTGNIGRPGTGANSITGQCNAMGSRLFSNTSGLIGGHDFSSETDRQKVAGVLGIAPEQIPDRQSLAYDQIIDGIETGRIKGLWIIATNTAHSWTNSLRGRRLLEKLEFLVVQDMYHSTETAQMADLYLPAAGWGEKEGTFINSERRFGVVRQVAKAPGHALSDFRIFRLLAEAWGCGDLFRDWTEPEAAFAFLRQITAGQPCDIGGIAGYAEIEAAGGIQWPFPPSQAAGCDTGAGEEVASPNANCPQERRLFADGVFYHPDGRARFLYDAITELPEKVDDDYPLQLMTGRGTVSQWHTQTRTAKSSVLRQLYPADCYIEVHPKTAAELKIRGGDRVRIVSRRGHAEARAVVTAGVGEGRCFMPMHYAETNILTLQHVDPHSRQPSYKNSAVRVEALTAKNKPKPTSQASRPRRTFSFQARSES